MNDETSTGKRSWQFSILNLLLLTTIVALSVTVAMLYRAIGPMRQELLQLRNEVGRLHIEDPTKLHAMQVQTDNELEWKWRIWVPEGKGYRVRSHGGLVAKEGFPSDGGTIYLRESGEHVIRYRILRDPRDGHWYGSMHAPGGSVGKDQQPWVKWRSRTSTSGGVSSSTRSFDSTAKRVEIIRHRVSETAKSSLNIEDPAAGFMIWLESD